MIRPRFTRSPLRRGTAVAVMAMNMVFVCEGCSLVRVGPAVQIQDVNSTDQANKNLEAIRGMQADRRRQQHAPADASRLSDAAERGLAPDGAQPSAPFMDRPVDGGSHARSMTPSSTPVRPQADAIATLPWTPPPVSRPVQPDRPVPAYTVPAPVGPDQSSSRCVPDGIAGQRCLR